MIDAMRCDERLDIRLNFIGCHFRELDNAPDIACQCFRGRESADGGIERDDVGSEAPPSHVPQELQSEIGFGAPAGGRRCFVFAPPVRRLRDWRLLKTLVAAPRAAGSTWMSLQRFYNVFTED